MSDPVRAALVGTGEIGLTAHLPALIAEPAVELVAVVDPDRRAREQAGVALGNRPARVLADVAELEQGAVDAWVVATPPWITPRLARLGLESDLFVLAEKPIATNLQAAEEAFAGLSPERAARLQVGFSYRHDPAIERLRDLVSGGALGEPLLMRATVYDEVASRHGPEHGERIRATLAHGLPIVHDGAHLIDWLRLLLGPEELAIEHAWSLRSDPSLPADNLCGATLTHPAGHRVLIEVGWLLPAAAPSVLTVRGAGGCARLDVMTLSLQVDDGEEVDELQGRGSRTERCFARQLERFVSLCRGESAAVVGGLGTPTLDDGLAGLAFAERLAEAMAVGDHGSRQR